MYVFVQESGHVACKKKWYTFTLGISLWVDLYMTREDWVFIVVVMVSDPTWEMMVSNIFSWPIGAVVELNAIVTICKYRRFRERYHFIPMTIEVHDAPKYDMYCFTKCAHFFHDQQSKSHLFLCFYIQFFKQQVNIAFQCALAYAIKRRKLCWWLMLVLDLPLLLNLMICM